MSQTSLPAEALRQLVDPYAVLGVAVTADERQILTRYHVLAKQLHPDRYNNSNHFQKKLATAIFTCLINPAYEQLKHKNKRHSILESLRSEAIAWKKQANSVRNPVAAQLLTMSAREAHLFYQDAIASYTQAQYQSLQKSHQITRQIILLNIVYLSLQKTEPMILQVNPPVKTKEKTQPVEMQVQELTSNETTNVKPAVINYAQKHYQRAIQYAKQSQWNLAVQELRDAIRIEPNNGDYYALLGFVHLRQQLPGMAKVYMRQALKLNSQQQLALKYADYLKISSIDNIDPPSLVKALGIAALLGKFVTKVETNISQVLKSL
jgi:curved DNA-binding protein CbpA